jgi:hypothetical protein
MKRRFWIVFQGFASGAFLILAMWRFREGGPDAWRGLVSLFFCIFFFINAMFAEDK